MPLDKQKMREYMKEYRKTKKDSGATQSTDLQYFVKLKQRVYQLLGGNRCDNCGCDDPRVLELNHINGGGCKEFKTKSKKQLMQDIVMGRRNKEEFNILCRPCNALHYVETVVGVKGYKIYWSKEE